MRSDMLIGGEWTAGSGTTFTTVNPATGEVLAELPEATGPTVFAGVSQDVRIAREEIFGPVLAVMPYDDPEELVALANDSEYGLAAAIWSRDIGTANRLARHVKAGTVWINMMQGR
ncbi:aldehyde dehydrogenase family protein [Streptomyces sp. NPDC019443]|uniref:aldehyde dehydrogenase family protein n=1 Tax=Streptomyces sp. NPDC019443 TaxID=3365061 RepID=UPI0037B0E24A